MFVSKNTELGVYTLNVSTYICNMKIQSIGDEIQQSVFFLSHFSNHIKD
ncbi:MAG: hypothetical protein ACI8ZO_000228 [Flavobacteriales bacterium]